MSPRTRACCACIVVVAATSCQSSPSPAAAPLVLVAGDATLSIDPSRAVIAWSIAGASRVTIGVDGLQVGSIDDGSALPSTYNFDPTEAYADPSTSTLPSGLAWHSVRSFSVASAGDASIALALTMDDASAASIVFTVERDRSIQAVFKPDPMKTVAFLRVRAHGSATEGFYGLGEYFDSVEHHGKVRAMQLAIDSSTESGDNEAHVPVPFVIGTSGWGLFVESRRPGAFGVALDAPEVVDATFATTTDSPNGLAFHLYAAIDPLDVTGLYYRSTSAPKLPAPWALGPWVWRNDVAGQAAVGADAKT
ncbi:MAG: hypothetical protein ACHREM_30045, partial [Polyangiales bacterium]